ncbi:hypothetical protein N7455_007294 [Penicillium solitum]|uniref:uncharacterized protein n=1 Tax=Penicillium solitum TaxID=60172 RepID=UPI0032C428F2|nr:hypothetical protein N7455_007294 [Penicillium solitum]
MSMHGAPLQMMGVSDIGAVAAEVLNLEAYQDCALSLVGDELTYSLLARIL